MIARLEGESTASARAWRWPLVIIGMLAAHATFLTWVAIVASSDRSFAIEPDYYAKGLAWDEQRAQLDANERIGWEARVTIGPATGVFGDRLLDSRLTDRDGAPILGATVTAEVFHHARGRDRLHLELLETAPGRYGVSAPIRRAGMWEVRLVVERGDDHFTHTETVQVSEGVR